MSIVPFEFLCLPIDFQFRSARKESDEGSILLWVLAEQSACTPIAIRPRVNSDKFKVCHKKRFFSFFD